MQKEQVTTDGTIQRAFYSAGFVCGKVNDGLKSLLGSEPAETVVNIRSLCKEILVPEFEDDIKKIEKEMGG